jgi:ribonuclease-3
MERSEPAQRIEDALGHRFERPERLTLALTHRSFAHENRRAPGDNERLEFLGDSILGAAAAELLYAGFPEASEGELTRRRADLVCERSLAALAERLGLPEALLLGRGEEKSGGRKKPRLLASALEAIVGAVYADGGFAAAHAVAQRVLAPALEALAADAGAGDFKSRLQERLQAERKIAPRYELEGTEGPEHARTFRVVVLLEGERLGEGSGRSKLEAEQAAAAAALRAGASAPPEPGGA